MEKQTAQDAAHPAAGERLIFHIDVNSAFLSWSAVKRLREDPHSVDIRTIPAIVGGDVQTRHGIVTAKSIPAKKYGIKTGEPVVKALQKCPDLLIVRSDFATYREYSKKFLAILKKYSPLVEQASIDEAYADMTPAWEAFEASAESGPAAVYASAAAPVALSGTASKEACSSEARSMEMRRRQFALEQAAAIRQEVRETLGFTINVGISVNRLLAKMASDMEKPDRTHTLYPEEIPAKMWPMPIGELHGCGEKTAERLRTLGILTIGDAAAMPEELLQSFLGEKGGEYIHRAANGISSDSISVQREEAKSYSNEETTVSDITAENYAAEMPPLLQKLSAKVAGRMQRDGVYAGTVGVMVKTNAFRRRSMQIKLGDSTNDAARIYETVSVLMERFLLGEDGILKLPGSGVRLVGVAASDLDSGEYRQMTLDDLAADGTAGLSVPDLSPAMPEQQDPHAVRWEPQTVPQGMQEYPGEALEEQQETPQDEQQDEQQDAGKNDRLRQMLSSIQARYGENAVRKGI